MAKERGMKVAFIGVGVMGEAMISALIKQKTIGRNAILACDIDPVRLAVVGKKYKVSHTADCRSAAKVSDVIVLSIKPQTMHKVLNDLIGTLKEGQVVLSIVAGASLETITKGLKHDAVVRVMPNTPAQVGQGISVWTATSAVSDAQKAIAQNILKATGQEIYPG